MHRLQQVTYLNNKITMKNQGYLIFILLWIGSISISCEKEKTEYEQTWDGHDFIGFNDGLFIVHESSIGYYYPDSNKVFPDIYKHQNGKGIGSGIHSLNASAGMITVENDNKIEYIDFENFVTIGFNEINRPRDISYLGQYSLVSFGNNVSGGVAIVDVFNRELVRTIKTGHEAGKIYRDGKYFYVLSSGKNTTDSTISVLYTKDFNVPQTLDVFDTITIGIRPVDYVEISLNFDSQHRGLAILCMGNKDIPASVVIFDLDTRTVEENYYFDNPEFKPESMFWIGETWLGSRMLAVYANGKLYQAELTHPMYTSVLIDKNVCDLYRYDQTYLAVSRDTVNPISYLYKFDMLSLNLLDSLAIDGNARNIEGTIHGTGPAEW
jgi:hypothetical protein